MCVGSLPEFSAAIVAYATQNSFEGHPKLRAENRVYDRVESGVEVAKPEEEG